MVLYFANVVRRKLYLDMLCALDTLFHCVIYVLEKKIGSNCDVTSQCLPYNGYCDKTTKKCACITGFREYENQCYPGNFPE